MASRSKQNVSGTGSQQKSVIGCGSSSRMKNKKESPPVPDSTTEPVPRPTQKFQEGDDVLYLTDIGKQMLGTVAEVRSQCQSCLVHFVDGNGTEKKLVPFKRLKKFDSDSDELDEPKIKKPDQVLAKQSRPQQICGSCGVSRRISAKKAKIYEETSTPFECRRCIKQSHSPNSPTSILRPFLATASNSLKGKLPPDVSITPMGTIASSNSIFSLPSTTSPHSIKSKTPSPNSSITIPRQIHVSLLPGRQTFNCFNCENPIQPHDRVHCTMCQRPCHLFCLSLTPPPLSGDKFWDVLCSSCGNQNTNEKVKKVFSVRRNINSWADVACLIISCLSVNTTQTMFDLEREMLPFLEANVESLHLPRMYKSHHPEARHRFILNTLNTSRLRFQNGREVKLSEKVWGVKNEQFLDRSQYFRNIATEMGLTQKAKKSATPAPASRTSIKTNSSSMSEVASCCPAPPPKSTTNSSVTLSTGSSFRDVQPMEIDSITSSDSIDSSEVDNVDETSSQFNSSLHFVDQIVSKKAVDVHPAIIDEASNSSSTSTSSSSESISTGTSSTSSATSLDKRKLSPIVRIKRKEMTSPKAKLKIGTSYQSPVKKRLKLEANLPRSISKNVDGPPLPVVPVKRIRKVVVKSPPRKTAQDVSCSDVDDDDEENMTLDTIKKLQSQRRPGVTEPCDKMEENETVEKPKSIKGKPKQDPKSKLPQQKARRGRPPGPAGAWKNPAQKPVGAQSSTTKGLRNLTSGKTSVPIVSRRVGTFNSISEKRPVPTPIVQDLTALDVISDAIYDAALHGGYRMSCLPISPQTDAEKRKDALKVFSHYRTEKENEIATALLGRKSEKETRSQTRQKSELFVGTHKRDLNDLDSYDVIGSRLDPDGSIRYQVIWKERQDGDGSFYSNDWYDDDEYSSSSGEEEDTMTQEKEDEKAAIERPFAALQLFGSENKSSELYKIDDEIIIISNEDSDDTIDLTTLSDST